MIELNLSEFKRHIELIVSEMGSEYVYIGPSGLKAPGCGCYYTHSIRQDDGIVEVLPGCIIGRVMLKAGIPMDVLAECDGDSESLVGKLTIMGLLSVDAETRAAMKLAQLMQDNGAPYGSVSSVIQNFASIMHIQDK